jgi:hypothetical protein
MKYVSAIIITLIIFGCKKDEPTNPINRLWSEGQPYAISDADAKATFYDYIMPGGLALPSYDAPVTYSGIDDPALAADIRQSLQDDKVPNPDKWVNKLNDASFKEKVGNDPYIAKFLLTGPSNSNATVLDVTETSLSRLLENTNGGIKYMDQAPPGITSVGSSNAFVHIDENNVKTLYLNREYAMANYGGTQRDIILNESMETTRSHSEPLTQDEQLYQLVLGQALNIHDAEEHFDRSNSHPTTSRSTQIYTGLNRYGLNGFDRSAETILGDLAINNPNSARNPLNTGEELTENQRNSPVYSGLSTASKPMRPDMAEYGHQLIGADPSLTTIGRNELFNSYILVDKILDKDEDLYQVFLNHLPMIKVR